MAPSGDKGKAPISRFSRDTWRQSLGNRPDMYKWLEAQERQQERMEGPIHPVNTVRLLELVVVEFFVQSPCLQIYKVLIHSSLNLTNEIIFLIACNRSIHTLQKWIEISNQRSKGKKTEFPFLMQSNILASCDEISLDLNCGQPHTCAIEYKVGTDFNVK